MSEERSYVLPGLTWAYNADYTVAYPFSNHLYSEHR